MVAFRGSGSRVVSRITVERFRLSSVPGGSSRPAHTSAPAGSLAAILQAVGGSAGAQLATSASVAISAERPAISECRCATLPGAGLASAPARERNQAVASAVAATGRMNARPASLLASFATSETQMRCRAFVLPQDFLGWPGPVPGGWSGAPRFGSCVAGRRHHGWRCPAQRFLERAGDVWPATPLRGCC